ncbi:MAG: AAA family ATPase, partial [Leptospiraceae bacterium]|nr:AAA family ATPase [Leptospiraceae bacterium]
GGPGTGKTTVLFSIIRALLLCGQQIEHIALLAPTGKAAKRMQSVVVQHVDHVNASSPAEQRLKELQVYTVHSFLRSKIAISALRTIIIDESSMLDTSLFYKLYLRIRGQGLNTIFCGDTAQLAAVEAGAFLQDIGNTISHQQPANCQLVALQQGFRSSNQIVQVLQQIKKAQSKAFLGLAGADQPLQDHRSRIEIQFYPTDTSRQRIFLQNRIRNWITKVYDQDTLEILRLFRHTDLHTNHMDAEWQAQMANLYAQLGKYRILALAWDGPGGIRDLNQIAHEALQAHLLTQTTPGTAKFASEQPATRHGLPVLVNRNQRDPVLMNGDSAVLLMDASGSHWALLESEAGLQLMPAHQMRSFETAFVQSVHKSQGSEYDHIEILLPLRSDHPLPGREIFYTAVSRARSSVVVCGSQTVIHTCFQRSAQRQTGPLPVT